MPWLLWSFDRQLWRRKELLIVDSSPVPFESHRKDVEVITMPPGCGIPQKRNRALGAARGEYVAWFDDDDWQHPQRLRRLVGCLADSESSYAGTNRSWFVDLEKLRCSLYSSRQLLFNTAVFRRDRARSTRFDESMPRGSDVPWMQAQRHFRHSLLARAGESSSGSSPLVGQTLGFWLCHEHNVSNPRSQRRCVLPLELLESELDAEAWGDTSEQLSALRGRLRCSGVGTAGAI